MVEVKNTCPFRQRVGLTKKGNPRMSYMLADPGPRQRVCRATLGNPVACTAQSACRTCAWFCAHCYDLIGQVLQNSAAQACSTSCSASLEGCHGGGLPLEIYLKSVLVQVNQLWVTQLQLEMLAAPAQSALLVSRSASKVSRPAHQCTAAVLIPFLQLHI